MQKEIINNQIIINTDELSVPQVANALQETRCNFYTAIQKKEFDVSIFVLAYGRLDKTKRCIESILKYTKGIQYELILVDNGSLDSTIDYFKSVKFMHKKVIKITKNIGGIFGLKISMEMFDGKYFVHVPNDIIVTKNWLNNLLRCMESDQQIGFVTPKSSNVSNLQQVDLHFTTEEEMQKQAALFNVSDSRKWEERLRLIGIVCMLKKEVIDNVGFFDTGFYHDFSEDDYAVRIRRMGYKMILCGDTWVHHDHDFRNMEDKDPNQFKKSLEAGRKNYQDKYFGLDAWDDINNFELGLINMLDVKKMQAQGIWRLLGIDVRCGMPILQVRNHLRYQGFNQSLSSYAFTTDAKYYQDLLFVTDGNVVCDRINYLSEHYLVESMDCIVVGEPINNYPKPISFMQVVIGLLKKNGKALVKLRNTADIIMFLNVIGMDQSLDSEMPVNISLQDFCNCLKVIGVKNIEIKAETHNIDQDTIREIKQALKKTGLCKNIEKAAQNICIKEYLLCIEK